MHGPASSRKSFGSTRSLAFWALLGGNLALAFGPMFVRLADSEAQVGPVAAAFWRLALAAPVLLILTRATGQPIDGSRPKAASMILLGGVFFAADLASWHLGILQTKMANATLLGNSASLIFPLYGFLIARRWPSRVQAFALVLAAAGAGLLMGRSYELSPRYLVGDLLSLLAGVLYTFYLISIDRARATLKPWPVLALSTLGGVLPLLLFAWLLGEAIWPAAWSPLIGLALVSQLIGQGLLVFAMGHVRPLVVGLAFLTQPVVGATVGWIGYGEALGLPDLAGAAAIAVAIVLVRKS